VSPGNRTASVPLCHGQRSPWRVQRSPARPAPAALGPCHLQPGADRPTQRSGRPARGQAGGPGAAPPGRGSPDAGTTQGALRARRDPQSTTLERSDAQLEPRRGSLAQSAQGDPGRGPQHSRCSTEVQRMAFLTNTALHSQQKLPEKIRGFFRDRDVRYAMEA